MQATLVHMVNWLFPSQSAARALLDEANGIHTGRSTARSAEVSDVFSLHSNFS